VSVGGRGKRTITYNDTLNVTAYADGGTDSDSLGLSDTVER